MTADVKQIGILLFDGVEELDAVGPWEVLSYWTRTYPDDGYAVSCISASGGTVECAKGLTIGAHHSYATMPALEVLIYPGGRGTRSHLDDVAQLDWLRRQRAAVPVVASVCTGALVLAAAGIRHRHGPSPGAPFRRARPGPRRAQGNRVRPGAAGLTELTGL